MTGEQNLPTADRPDSELQGIDIRAALARGLLLDGVPRRALFTEAAIAASWQVQDLDIGPYPVVFLARFVRTGGILAALELPEPLIGAAPTALARDWLAAARSAGTGLAVERLFAQWLDMVAALVALRRCEADRRRSAAQAPATVPGRQNHG